MRRGWEHETDRDLSKVVNRLSVEIVDHRWGFLFYTAYNLHVDGDIMPKEFIETGLEQVEKFIQGIERFLTEQS